MPERFLGIDTSNYRTSAAIYNAETGEWVNRGGLLTVPEGAIGLRQSDALFQHTVRLHEKIEALPQGEVRAIGVSTRPRAVEGSYMPCFLAGESVARSAAHLLSVPLFTVSHQQGHIAAAALSAGKLDLLDGEFLAWHLSGGTSELLHVKCGADGLPDCTCIGGTTDLAAGQLLDRAGNLLGLPFPSGGSATHEVTARREGEKVTLPSVKLEATVTDANGNKRIGITFAELPDSLGMHLSMSVRTAVNYARLVWSSVGMLVSGQVGVDQLSGPVGVAEVMADTAKYSMISFFQLVAFISINLGVMNLLPLPALDGGRLVFLIIEGIRRKPVPPKYEGYVHAAGLMLLLMLMVYVTGQDVLRIFMRSN